jgi:hypothetical protein
MRIEYAKEQKKYMMATKAIHKLGDISRDSEEICRIYAEEGDDYIGAWVEGFGFFDVKFPKATTRDLTPEEKAHYNTLSYQISDHPPFKLDIK